MGRFYKTAKPDFLDDIIYQPPWELMKDVINTHDERINKTNEDIDAFETLMAEVNNIQDDDPAVNEKLTSYREKIDSLSKSMQGDLPNYRKYSPQISTLKKELERDLDNGLLGRANEAYTEREKEFARLDSMKNVDPKKIAQIKRFYDLNYTDRKGLSFENKDKYNKFLEQQINPEEVFDESGFINNLQSHFASNKDAYASSGPGNGYIWTKSGTTEYINEDKVREYMRNTPEMEKWRSTTKQDIMLEAYNNGLRGTQLDAYIKDELERREKGFIEAAANQIGFKKEDKTASTSVDSRDLAFTKRGWDLDDKEDEPLVEGEVEVDRRTTEEKEEAGRIVGDIMAMDNPGFDNSSERSIISALSEAVRQGDLQGFIDRTGIACTPRQLRDIVVTGSKLGERVNLVDIDPNKPMTAEDKLNYRKEIKAVEGYLRNLDPTEARDIVITSNFADGSQLQKGTVLEMFNKGMVDITNIGGTQQQNKTEKVAPPLKDDEGKPYWVDSKGNDITFSDKLTYPRTEAEAKVAAQETGVKLKTIEEIQYQNVLGNKISVVDSRLHRYKSANGMVDNYEIEMTVVKEVDGEQVFEKAIVQVPAKSIKVKAQ